MTAPRRTGRILNPQTGGGRAPGHPGGIQVSQQVIGDPIVAGDKEKDPPILADFIRDLDAKRDRFRVEVASG